jgi:hypothetical protein
MAVVFITCDANPRRTFISSKQRLFLTEPLPFSIWEVEFPNFGSAKPLLSFSLVSSTKFPTAPPSIPKHVHQNPYRKVIQQTKGVSFDISVD